MAGPSALGWAGATDENINEIASEDYLQGFIENDNLKVYVGKTRNKIVGFCATRKIDEGSVELAGIIVRQDQVDKGVGTGLFRMAERDAVEDGFATMLVKTESNNNRALSFYKNKGFREQRQVIEELNKVKVNLTVLTLALRRGL